MTLAWYRKGIKINGKYLDHLRFADDIVLISSYIGEILEMLEELQMALKKIGLTMNLSKTKIMTAGDNIALAITS